VESAAESVFDVSEGRGRMRCEVGEGGGGEGGGGGIVCIYLGGGRRWRREVGGVVSCASI